MCDSEQVASEGLYGTEMTPPACISQDCLEGALSSEDILCLMRIGCRGVPDPEHAFSESL